MHRKHKVKSGRKSRSVKDEHDGCDADEPEVSCGSIPTTGPHQGDCTKLLDDTPSFEWDDIDALWERLEEEDWLGNVCIKYFNPVTRKLRSAPPGVPNVCSYIHTTFDNQEIEVFAPLKCVEKLGKAVVKTGCVEKWSDAEDLWCYGLTFREVQHDLMKNILLAKMEENACLQLKVEEFVEENARLQKVVEDALYFQVELEENSEKLQEQVLEITRAQQEKEAKIAVCEETVEEYSRLLDEKEEENAQLQDKLDTISAFLIGKIGGREKPSVPSKPNPPPFVEDRTPEDPSLQPHREVASQYVVDCTHNKTLSGVYKLHESNTHRHVDGVFALSCSSGLWTITDNGKVLCKAVDTAQYPDEVQNWLYLTHGRFRPAFPMTVQERKEDPQPSPIIDASNNVDIDNYVEKASDWVHVMRPVGFFNHVYEYHNKVTKKRQDNEPEILKRK